MREAVHASIGTESPKYVDAMLDHYSYPVYNILCCIPLLAFNLAIHFY